MNQKRKMLAMEHVIHLLSIKGLTLHDQITYDEMANYVQRPFGDMGPASSKGHDDTVTSLAIAVVSTTWNSPLAYPGYDDDKEQVNDLFDEPMWEAFKSAAV